MTEHPCETCLRWPECNGVDADNCPVVAAYILDAQMEQRTA